MSGRRRISSMQRKDALRRSSGMPYPFASRSLIKKICSMRATAADRAHPASTAGWSASAAHRAPAPDTRSTPHNLLLPRLRPRNAFTTASSDANSCAGYFWSRTGFSRPPSKLYSARWILVPPTSPARIILTSSIVRALPPPVRQLGRRSRIQQQGQLPALRAHQLRRLRLRIVRPQKNTSWITCALPAPSIRNATSRP
jgi:hypothetical protein